MRAAQCLLVAGIASLSVGATAALPRVETFFAGQEWHGTYQTMSYFASNTTSFHSCGSSVVTVPNASMAFGPAGDRVDANVSMPLDVGEYPGESPSLMRQVFAGQFSARMVQKFPSARDASFEYTVGMEAVDVDTDTVAFRSGLMCVKLALKHIAGGYRSLRYVERGGVSGGTFGWSSCPSVASDVDCTSSRQFNAMRLYPRSVAWHAEPWSACVPGTNRTRAVACLTEYGAPADEAGCLARGDRPADWEPCAAVSVPAAVEGRFVALLHAPAAVGNLSSAEPAEEPVGHGRHLLAMANLTVTASDNAALAAAAAAAGVTAPAAPGAVLSVGPDLYGDAARDALASGALDDPPGVIDTSRLSASAFSRLSTLRFRARSAAATLTGASATLLQGRNATGAPFAVAVDVGAASSPSGATAGLDAGPGGFALAWSPELAASAGAFGAAGRESRALVPDDADAAAALTPRASVLAGVATRAPVAYVVQPFGACLYSGPSNRCERRRPAPTCRNGDGDDVDPAFCARSPRPSADTTMLCSGCRRYDVTPWSTCSAVCGGGARTRSVRCVDASNATATDASCEALLGPKPAEGEACGTQSCAEYRVGGWSSCSKACGQGAQTRPITCVDDTGPVPAARCDAESVLFPSGPPNATRSCFNCPCEDGSRAFAPLVRIPPSLAGADAKPGLNASAAGRWSPLLASGFCPAGHSLLRLSEWRCFPSETQRSMCAALGAAASPRVLPFAFRAEPGVTGTLPASLPRPRSGSPEPDILRVRPDASCLFLDYDFEGSAFADVTRQAAVGACRADA